MDVDAVFTALADRSRRRVIATLAADQRDSPQACGSFELPVGKATRTHHFRVLREAGLIEQRHHGNGSSVTLRRAYIDAHLPGLLNILVTELRGQAPERSGISSTAVPEAGAPHPAPSGSRAARSRDHR